MPTTSVQRQVALLTIPLAALSAVTLHITTVAASVQTDRLKMAQNTSVLPVLVAQRSRVQRMRFANGEDSAAVKASVVNGTRDMYLLGAQKGQTMQVKITSLERNAVFDIVAPSNKTEPRRLLKQEVVTWSEILPDTGDYQIVVGSTRGNASYRLEVTIR